MKINFDDKEMKVLDASNNIVDIAEKNGVYIPAPCYRDKKAYGCCNGCLIIADGEKKMACTTKPTDGMNIIYDRSDLAEIRKERIKAYAEAKKSNSAHKNTCGISNDSKEKTSCGCSSNSSCGPN